AAAYAHPAALGALGELSARVGTLAVITGRPAEEAVELGGLGEVPGLIVLGHYGWERGQGGAGSSPPPPPGGAGARERPRGGRAAGGAAEGVRVGDKGSALAVPTRHAADPVGAQAGLEEPLGGLAAATGLTLEPGRLVIELRPPGRDKGTALTSLVSER